MRTIGTLWGLESVALRVFNAYGPGQPLPASHAPVIPRFLRQAQLGGSLVVHGDGSQTRDYIYIDEVVEALVSAASAQDVDRQVNNVGSGHETSVRDLARLAGEATGQKIEVLYSRADNGGVSRMCADIRLAAEKLNFRPRVGLAEGLGLCLQRDPRFQFKPV